MECEAFDLNIEQSDHRVSYEILTVKINVSTNEISVEHKKKGLLSFKTNIKVTHTTKYFTN